jgi:hypothetical protein
MPEVKKIESGQPVDDLVDPLPAETEAPPPSPFRCAVSAELFLRAWHARSTEKERPQLSGVYIEPCPGGGATLTATNGGLLISIRDPNALIKGSAIVNLSDLMVRACKPKKSDIDVTERVLMIDNFDGQAMPEAIVAHAFVGPEVSRDDAFDLFYSATELIIARQYGEELIVNATFPSWRGIIPHYGDEAGQSGACWDARVLRILAAALTAPGGKQTPLSWFTCDPDPTHSPLLVKPYPFNLMRYDMAFEGFAIVMPYKSEATCEVPEWARRAA